MMKKRAVAKLLLTVSTPIVFPAVSYAQDTRSVPPPSQSQTATSKFQVIPYADRYFYRWFVTHVSSPYYAYSGWHYGTAGYSPGPISFSQSLEVTNGYSGSLEVSASEISDSVGWDISSSYQSQATYGPVSIPNGKRYEIVWRGLYEHKNVTQSLEMSINDAPYNPTGTVKMLYPSRFDGFDYEVINITSTGPKYT